MENDFQPRFAGTLKASASFANDGRPHLEIDVKEMERLESILYKKLGKRPTMRDLFEYVWEAQKQ